MVRIFLIAHASEHCMIHGSPCNAVNSGFMIQFTSGPGKKLGVLREGDYVAGHAITRVQMHVQSTIIAHLLLCHSDGCRYTNGWRYKNET